LNCIPGPVGGGQLPFGLPVAGPATSNVSARPRNCGGVFYSKGSFTEKVAGGARFLLVANPQVGPLLRAVFGLVDEPGTCFVRNGLQSLQKRGKPWALNPKGRGKQHWLLMPQGNQQARILKLLAGRLRTRLACNRFWKRPLAGHSNRLTIAVPRFPFFRSYKKPCSRCNGTQRDLFAWAAASYQKLGGLGFSTAFCEGTKPFVRNKAGQSTYLKAGGPRVFCDEPDESEPAANLFALGRNRRAVP